MLNEEPRDENPTDDRTSTARTIQSSDDPVEVTNTGEPVGEQAPEILGRVIAAPRGWLESHGNTVLEEVVANARMVERPEHEGRRQSGVGQ